MRLASAAALVGIAVTAAPAVGSALPNLPASASGPAPCSYHPAGQAARNVGVPDPSAAATPFTMMLHTNTGAIGIAMRTDAAPCTTNSFRFLAQHKYFDGTSCHRLTTQGIYVLQCGDPTGTGTGGPGYAFADENLAGATYPAGTVAMANAGPGTNGSQFFLVYRDSQLPPNYTPFGRITSGLGVVNTIAAKGDDGANGVGDGHPRQPVSLGQVTVG